MHILQQQQPYGSLYGRAGAVSGFNGFVAGDGGWAAAGVATRIHSWPCNTAHMTGTTLQDTTGTASTPLVSGSQAAGTGPSGDAGYARDFASSPIWYTGSPSDISTRNDAGVFDSWTVCFWAYTPDNTAAPGGNRMRLVANQNGALNFFTVLNNSSFAAGAVGVGWGDPGQPTVLGYTLPTNSLPNNTWTHFAFSCSTGTAMTAYVNGISTAAATTANNITELGFGVVSIGGNGADTFNGKLAEVVFYNSALSSGNINTIMNAY